MKPCGMLSVNKIAGMKSSREVALEYGLDEELARHIFTLCHRNDLDTTEKQLHIQMLWDSERKVGELVRIGDTLYRVERGDSCEECGLVGRCAKVYHIRGACSGENRSDNRSVHFREIQ